MENDYYGVLWLQIDAVEFDHYIIVSLLLHIIVVISRKFSSLIEKFNRRKNGEWVTVAQKSFLVICYCLLLFFITAAF